MKTSSVLLSLSAIWLGVDAACPTSDSISIQNQGDTSQVQDCTSYSGSVTIEKQTSGTVSLSGIRQIGGDLIVDGATNLTSLGADSLESIGGKFTLNNLQNLQTASFPRLTSVGNLAFTGLPNLGSLNFDSNLRSAQTVSIQNTFLGSLSGINLQQVNAMTIANNRMLQSVNFQVSSVSGTIMMVGNGDKFQVQLPNLQTAQNITIRSANSVSIPSLSNVTGNLGFYENSFTSFEAVNLTSVGQTLAINANPNLNNVSLPLLKTIGGGFQVQNNTQLLEVEFPTVQAIGGALDFYGGFNKVSLPALKDCRGGFNLQSSGSVDCSPFSAIRGSNSVIKGTFKCFNQTNNPGNINNNPSGGKKGAASLIMIPGYLLGAAGLVAGLMSML